MCTVVPLPGQAISTAYTGKISGTGGGGYFALSKAVTLSDNDASEYTLTGGRLLGAAVLVLDSVVICTPPGVVVPVRAFSWVNVVTTLSRPSSASRRLSREFRL